MNENDATGSFAEMLTLRQLEIFNVASGAESFSAAARRLEISQPTLSTAISRIERQLEVRLFDRSTRMLTLTIEGERLAIMAADMLAIYRSSIRSLKARTEAHRERLTVMALPSIAASVVPAAVERFVALHPDIDLTIHDTGRKQGLDLVLDRIADFALLSDAPRINELRYEPLAADRFVIVVHASSPLAGLDKIGWSDLAREPVILVGNQATRARIERTWLAAGHDIVPRFSVEQVSTALALAAHQLGSVLLPELYLTPALLGELRAVPLDSPELLRRIELVHRNDRPLSDAARLLADLIRADLSAAR
jgi:DNA-binding transcriptional LysR family regulator